MKKSILYIIILFIILTPLVSSGQNWQWARSSSDTFSLAYATSCIADASGNVYETGYFYDYITFGTTVLNCEGFSMFLVKYSSSGNIIWAQSASDTDHDNKPFATTTDNAGNVYVAGYFSSPTITFGTTTLINTTGGASSLFIVKYNSLGNLSWARTAATTGIGAAEPYSIVTDADDNIYVTGYYNSSSIIFDSVTLYNIVSGLGANNMFLVKFNSTGHAVWAKHTKPLTPSSCEGDALAIDHSGNILVSGTFGTSTVTFDTITLSDSNTTNIFLAKYDVYGNVIWAKNIGGSNWDFVRSMASGTSDDVYIAGYFESAYVIFDADTFYNLGGYNAFLVKCNTSGISYGQKAPLRTLMVMIMLFL